MDRGRHGLAAATRVIVSAVALALLGAMTIGSATSEERSVSVVIKNHRFEPSEIEIPAGTKVRLLVRNEDDTPEEFESHVLHREKVVRPGREAVIFIGPLEPGRYDFVGEFHPDTARGAVVVR